MRILSSCPRRDGRRSPSAKVLPGRSGGMYSKDGSGRGRPRERGKTMSDARNTVEEEVYDLLQRFNREGLELRPETDLNAELMIDSVAAMDLIMEIEDSFDIDIPINLVGDLRCIQDLVTLVRKQQGD